MEEVHYGCGLNSSAAATAAAATSLLTLTDAVKQRKATISASCLTMVTEPTTGSIEVTKIARGRF